MGPSLPEQRTGPRWTISGSPSPLRFGSATFRNRQCHGTSPLQASARGCRTLRARDRGTRFVDINADHEPEFAPTEAIAVIDHTKIDGRRVLLTDLLDAGYV